MKSESIEYLFYVISRHDKGFLTAEEIALESGNSIRNIFYSMNELKAYCLSNGCKLVSVKGKGYRIEIDDQQLFNDAKKRLEIRFRNSDIAEDGYYHDFDLFITSVLNNARFRSISDIAHALWVSETRAAVIPKNASNILSYYNISLEKKDGVYVLVGHEINIRIFMLRFVNDNNQTALNIEAGYSQQQLKYLQQCLMKNNVLIKDHLTIKLALYLSLACSRNAAGFVPDLSEYDVSSITNTDEYRCACEIIKEYSQCFTDIPSETFALALVLLCNEQYYGRPAERPAFISELTEQYCSTFINFLNERGIPMGGNEDFYRDLYCSFIPVAFQQYYHITEISDYSEYRWEENLRNYFLPVSLASKMEQIFDFRIKRTTMMNIARFINTTINSIHYPLRHLNIAVCSSRGWLNARMISNDINNLFRGFIVECVPYELYQVSESEGDGIDCIIGDFSELMLPRDMRYLEIRHPLENSDILEIVNFLAHNALDIQPLLSGFLKKDDCICFSDYEISSMDDFADMIALKRGKDRESREELKTIVNTLTHYFTRSSMIYLLSREYTSENFVEYYSLAKPLRIDNRKISDIYVLSIDIRNNPVILKLVSNMISAIIDETQKPKEDLYGYLKAVTEEYIIRKSIF
ncbi:MAG: helix-turn-helix domain-containing protein [Erysipelotrichaceae bacterium]|nr:helix-turn-helix domain-containing protein [Erysipelotrichaceae bacterium]